MYICMYHGPCFLFASFLPCVQLQERECITRCFSLYSTESNPSSIKYQIHFTLHLQLTQPQPPIFPDESSLTSSTARIADVRGIASAQPLCGVKNFSILSVLFVSSRKKSGRSRGRDGATSKFRSRTSVLSQARADAVEDGCFRQSPQDSFPHRRGIDDAGGVVAAASGGASGCCGCCTAVFWAGAGGFTRLCVCEDRGGFGGRERNKAGGADLTCCKYWNGYGAKGPVSRGGLCETADERVTAK
jgi:hypothetical protein